MKRRSAGATVVIVIAVLAVTACGGTSPQATASADLAKAGATADGAPYMVAQGLSGASCDVGSAEADGFIGSQETVVCVFPSKSLRDNNAATSLQADSGGTTGFSPSAVIIGDDALLYLEGAPASLVRHVATQVHGSVV